MLCISTSFRVLRAPKSWSKPSFSWTIFMCRLNFKSDFQVCFRLLQISNIRYLGIWIGILQTLSIYLWRKFCRLCLFIFGGNFALFLFISIRYKIFLSSEKKSLLLYLILKIKSFVELEKKFLLLITSSISAKTFARGQ